MTSYKRKWIAVTLALAVAFSTLLPFFATYNTASTPTKIASFFGEKILICTGDGFALVNWKDLLAGKTPVKQHKAYTCPLCYLAASGIGNALLLAAAAIFLTRKKSAGPSLISLENIVKPRAYTTPSPRAPPTSFCN